MSLCVSDIIFILGYLLNFTVDGMKIMAGTILWKSYQWTLPASFGQSTRIRFRVWNGKRFDARFENKPDKDPILLDTPIGTVCLYISVKISWKLNCGTSLAANILRNRTQNRIQNHTCRCLLKVIIVILVFRICLLSRYDNSISRFGFCSVLLQQEMVVCTLSSWSVRSLLLFDIELAHPCPLP